MTRIEIKQLVNHDDIAEILAPILVYAFNSSPLRESPEDLANFLKRADKDTLLVLFEDDKPVASVCAFHMNQNVRNKLFRHTGISGVACYPEARRKGYIRQLMEELFRRTRDDTFSGLYPFRESFYEKMGYVSFQQAKFATLDPARLAPLLKADFAGSVRRVWAGDFVNEYREFLKKVQKVQHGMVLFPDHHYEMLADGNSSWIAVAEDGNGEIIAMLSYRINEDDWYLKSNYFLYLNTEGRQLILQWIAMHIDQIQNAKIRLNPSDQPELWHSDLVPKVETDWEDDPMGRIVDVSDIGGMQVGEGSFSAKIVDTFCPWNDGAFEFSGENGELVVRKVDEAECEISIQALTGLVFGVHDPANFEYRGWGKPSPDTQERMRQLFGPMVPHVSAMY